MPTARIAYELHVSLLNVSPGTWRRLIVPNTMSLSKFHDMLQLVLGWENYHLHSFVVDDLRIGPVDPEFDDGTVDERRKTIKTILKEPGDLILYEYDFGDGWEHEVLLDSCFEVDPRQPLPVCIDGEGACPPEDVGGPGGYADFLEALASKSHPRHDELLTWIGGFFEADFFDIHSTNVLLGKRFARDA